MQALLVEAADGNQQVAAQAKLIYSVAEPGCLSRIPAPTFFHPESQIRIFFHSGPRIGIKKMVFKLSEI